MNKKGFTLIELLAVIIILGILMIIAIPSVTQYINNSRKSAYVDTAKEIIAGARNMVNEGKLEMFSTETTYYIPASMIGTENGQKSPYGDFTEAYVAVTYDGHGYNYYWISVDTAGQGVKNITRLDKLSEDDIESDISSDEINNIVENTGIGGRKIVYILQNDYTWYNITENAENNVSVDGGESAPLPKPICKRATTLHNNTTCSKTSSDGCNVTGQAGNGNKIIYGNDPATRVSGTLIPGDAFDCDVNDDKVWDPETERFYYVTNNGTNSVLIYYANVTYNSGPDEITAPTQDTHAYDSTNKNWNGPQTAYKQLPSKTLWKNEKIIEPRSTILNDINESTTNGGTISFSGYIGKAARFLTYQEVIAACGDSGMTSIGYLNNYSWLLENIGTYESTSGAYGYWLETPEHTSNNGVFRVAGLQRRISDVYACLGTSCSGYYGVRPVIEVLTTDMDY